MGVVNAEVVAAVLASDGFPSFLEHGLKMTVESLLGHSHVLILDNVVDLDGVGDGFGFPAEDLFREVGLNVEEFSSQHPGPSLVDVDIVFEKFRPVVGGSVEVREFLGTEAHVLDLFLHELFPLLVPKALLALLVSEDLLHSSSFLLVPNALLALLVGGDPLHSPPDLLEDEPLVSLLLGRVDLSTEAHLLQDLVQLVSRTIRELLVVWKRRDDAESGLVGLENGIDETSMEAGDDGDPFLRRIVAEVVGATTENIDSGLPRIPDPLDSSVDPAIPELPTALEVV